MISTNSAKVYINYQDNKQIQKGKIKNVKFTNT